MGGSEGEYGGMGNMGDMGDIHGTSIDFIGENGAMFGFSENEIFYSDDAPSIVINAGAAIAISTATSDTLYLDDSGVIMNLDSTDIITNGVIIGGSGNDALTFTGAQIYGEADLKDGNDTVILQNASNNISVANVENIHTSQGIDVIEISGTSSTLIYSSTGADTFNLLNHGMYVDQILYSGTSHGGDTIKGFEDATSMGAVDKIVFSRAAFTAGDTDSNGAMDAAAFSSQVNSTSSGANFIYNTTNTTLYYDADGAAGSEVLIATFDPLQTIVATDITFVA
jgi:hypothetical protein